MFWAVLVVILKALGWTLGFLAFACLLALALPVRIRLSGEASLTGLFEALSGEFGTEDSGSVDSGSVDSSSVIVSGQGRVQASVLGGMVALNASTERDAQLRVLGIRLRSWKDIRSAKRDAGDRDALGERGVPGERGDLATRDVHRERHGGDGRDKDAARGGLDAAEGECGQGGGIRRLRVSLGKSLGEARKYLAPKVRKRTLAFAKEVWRLLNVGLDADVEYGFDDPGYTGMLYAAYVSLGGALGLQGLRLRPDFSKEMLEASGNLQMRFNPLALVWSLGRFAFSREIRPLWWKRRLRLFHAKNSA